MSQRSLLKVFKSAWALGFLAASFVLTASAHEQSNLRSPDGKDRPRGEARIGGDEISVRGDDLAGHIDVSIMIADESGTLQNVATATTDSEGEFEYEARTGSLPLGADSPSDFAGRAVQVNGPDGSPLLVGSFPRSAPEADDERGVGTSALTPPAGAPFPNATGRIRVKAEDGRHDLEVRVLGLQAETVYSVTVTNSAGETETIGKITTNQDGNGALEVDTDEDDDDDDEGALPFGAAGAGELAGFALKVSAEDGTVVLEGTIPEIGEKEERENLEAEFDLSRPADGPEGNIRGDVRIESEENDDEDKSRVRIRDAKANATYSAVFSSPDGSETEELGKLTTDDRGEAELEVEDLPLHADSVSQLAGVLVKVLNADNAVVLSGTVPQVGNDEDPEEAERLRFVVNLAQPEPPILPNAHGSVKFEEDGDEHEMEVEVEDLIAGANFKVEIRDGSGNAEVLAEGAADAAGDLRKNKLFLGTDPLPLGAAKFADLAGFTIVVLNDAGDTVLKGTVNVPGSGAALALPISFKMVGSYDAAFLRGDANRDSQVNITDAINVLETLFAGKAFFGCEDAMDSNDDGQVDISDPVTTLIHLFIGTAGIPFPGTFLPGFDPTPDGLFCRDQ